MADKPLKSAKRILALAGFFGAWAIIVFFIGLLTFIFSFLGTILCAVLAGMMCGTLRMRWWKAAGVAPLFPAVLVGMLRASKSEMANSQVLALAVLCFGTFWGTYGLARALFWHESKASAGATRSGSGNRRPPRAELLEAAPASPTAANARTGVLNLALLQGNWCCRSRTEGEVHRKRMSIAAGKLTLQTANAQGQFSTLAEAHIRLCTANCLPTLLVSEAGAESDSDTLVSI